MLPVAIPATIWLKKRSGFSQGGWAARNAAVGAVRTVVIWPSDSICNSSISQVGASHRFVPLQLLRRRLYHDVPCLKHVAVLGYGESQAHVLLHQEDRCVFLAVDRLDDAEDLADDERGQPQGGFIEGKEPGPRHEPAADGEHLLLAAGEGVRGLLPPLSEDGEVAEEALHIEPDGGAAGAGTR